MKPKVFSYLIMILLLASMSNQVSSKIDSPTISNNDNTTQNLSYDNSPESIISIDNIVENDLQSDQLKSKNIVSPNVDSVDTSFIPKINDEMAELPNNFGYWSESSVELKNSFSSYYSSKAIIKMYEDDRVELVIKSNSGELSEETLRIFAGYNVKIIQIYRSMNAFVVTIPKYRINDFINSVESLVDVLYVEPNFYSSINYIPNDPEWANQYGPQIIGMETAWEMQLGSTNVLVAIIDTGIDYNHPDLGNYLPLGYDFYNDDADPMDDNGHGTHVSGTIAASIDNAIGIAGIANVSIFGEKFLSADGYGSDIGGAQSIIHAVDQGADILSNSWGGYGYSQVLADAVQYALDSGVLVVAASGNDATNEPHYPSAYPGVISVGATDINDELAYFSNWGDTIDVTAPGVDILSTLPGGYGSYSGTSMATPHVSGVLALLKSNFPTYTASMLENLMYNTATDLGSPGYDEYFGYGRVDAATAVFGLQDHDLVARLNVPSIIPNNMTTNINTNLINNGIFNESNVDITLYINSTMVYNDTIQFVQSGYSYPFVFNFTPSILGSYNITFDVSLVLGENITSNNNIQKMIIVSDPVINPLLGNEFAYRNINFDGSINSAPFNYKFVVLNDLDRTAVEMGYYFYNENNREEILIQEFTLNTITRKTSLWERFPYWINPDVQIGDMIGLFTATPSATVIGETIYSYYGVDVAVWIVDDGSELVLFSKSDGILMTLLDYNNIPFLFSMSFTDILPIDIENSGVKFITPVSAVYNETSIIEFIVQNTGNQGMSTVIETYINGEMSIFNVSLPFGGYEYLSISWVPPYFGVFNASVYAYELLNEFYIEDNFDVVAIDVIDLYNYDVSNPAYLWYDAVANGYNLGMIGDDISIPVKLPFMFEFYGSLFDTMYISSNGWISFGDTDPLALYSDPFPTLDLPFAIAPFLSDLKAENNIYVWENNGFIVIEYSHMNYVWDERAGSFEIILFPNGDIVFQYDYLNWDYSTKGLNYGLNLGYYSAITDNLSFITEYNIKFRIPGTIGGLDILQTELYVPDLTDGESGFIYASVSNVGTTTEYNVVLYLYIDNIIKSAVYTEILPSGENISIAFFWQNVDKGSYEIKAETPSAVNEEELKNNIVIIYKDVGTPHDLSILLNIYFDGSMYIISSIVENMGLFDEMGVQVELYINDVLVNMGFISYLASGSLSSVGYFWSDYTEGTYNIEAYVLPVQDEDNISNNVASQIITIGNEEYATIGFNITDFDTGLPLENVEIYMHNQFTNETYYGRTDANGYMSLLINFGEYLISFYLADYGYEETYTIIEYSGYYEYYITLNHITDRSFSILSPQSGDSIAGGLVYMTFNSSDFTDISYINVYINGIFITNFYIDQNDAVVPVFNNGTNTIELEIIFSDGITSYVSVDIWSYDVVPTVFLEIGDYIEFQYLWQQDQLITITYDIIVVDFYSEFEVAINLTSTWNYEDGNQTVNYYYLVVNTLNGYISDTNTPWTYQHFMFFTGMATPDNIGTSSLPNLAIQVSWGSVFSIAGETVWNGYDVWVMNNSYSEVIYVIKSNGLFVRIEIDTFITGEIITSSLLPSISEIPIVDSPLDIEFEQGSAVNIYWNATDDNPTIYEIYINGISIVNGSWVSGVPIWINIDNLQAGIYFVDIVLWDSSNNFKWDTVIITVVDTTAPITSSPTDLTITVGDNSSITWNASDLNADNYTILNNGSEVEFGKWTNNSPIEYNLDLLGVGNYEITVIIIDSFGNVIEDVVFVTVNIAYENIPPSTQGVTDFSYEFGSIKNTISWDVSDENPDTYNITMNGKLLESGSWLDLKTIEINIDNLMPNRYEFILQTFDIFGNMSSDTVVVYVIPVEEIMDELDDSSSKKTPGFNFYLAILSILGMIGVYRFRKFN